MPLYLEPKDVISDLEDFHSVLIVPCPICPPMSLAMQTKTPFIDLFEHGIKTGAFEDYIQSIREPLDERGIRTEVLTIRAPLPLMCLWTQGQRQRLVERAKDFEAVLVLGCNSATVTAKDALKDTDCQVFQAMANATTKFGFPPKMELERHPVKKPHRRGPHPTDAESENEAESI